MEITQAETGAILDDTPIEIGGAHYFEEKVIPHKLFDSFSMVGAGKTWLLMGCVHGAFRMEGKCLVIPGGGNAQAVASFFHPMDQLPRIRARFIEGLRNRRHQKVWRRFRKIEKRILDFSRPRAV